MDSSRPTNQADRRNSRPERLPRVVDWATARQIDADGYVDIDLAGFAWAIERWRLHSAALMLAIGLTAPQVFLQEDLAIRVAFGTTAAAAIVARLVLSTRWPDPADFVRRDP